MALDPAVWGAMMATAGPADAPWLRRQILRDLARMQADLAQALAAGDIALCRRVCHALAGLAGTIGAPLLHGAAQRMNAAARQADDATVASLGAAVLGGLETIRAAVLSTPEGQGPT